MLEVTVIAALKLATEHRDEALREVREALEVTAQEPGCTSLTVYHDAADDDRIVLIEQWQSQALFNQHMSQPYMARLAERGPVLFAAAPDVQVLRAASGQDQPVPSD
jgi:quinol monooxygenase YgiN